jgi:hypothetical protein
MVKAVGIRGKIKYIDWKYLNLDYMYPVQLELEKAYYDDEYETKQPNTNMYRCGLKDLDLDAQSINK